MIKQDRTICRWFGAPRLIFPVLAQYVAVVRSARQMKALFGNCLADECHLDSPKVRRGEQPA